MNESELKKVYFFLIYLRGSKIYTNEDFVNIDIGEIGGTHWTCF